MSQILIDAVRACFPCISEDETHDLLWGETCFPFGMDEQVRNDIHEARVRRTIRPGFCEMDGWHHHSERK